MNGLNGYSQVQATEPNELPKLPVGGYVLKILGVYAERTQRGERLVFDFDICEGEFSGFYDKLYKLTPDSWANKKWKGTYRLNAPQNSGDDEKYKRSLGYFKSQIEAFEKSNSGLKINCEQAWDERILIGKTVGALFNEKEWEMDGKTGFFTQCKRLTAAEIIRSGNFKIPERDLLPKDTANDSFGGYQGGFNSFNAQPQNNAYSASQPPQSGYAQGVPDMNGFEEVLSDEGAPF